MMNLIQILDKVVDKDSKLDVGTGALYSIVAIVMVFAILLIIIGITTLIFKANGLFKLKKELEVKQNKVEPVVEETSTTPKEVVIEDDDMMAAVLVATIDYRNEIKKDVRVVSVKEIK